MYNSNLASYSKAKLQIIGWRPRNDQYKLCDE